MDEEQLIHEISIAYLLHRSSSDNPETAEDFYQEYKRAIDEFKNLINND